MRSLHKYLLVFVLIHCGIVYADDIPKVSRYFTGSLQGVSFSGKQFTVSWQYSEYDGRKVNKWAGGDSLEPPHYVVQNISLEVAGKKVSIPNSAYYDIYDPAVYAQGPYLMEDKSNMYLIINASDGAGSAEIWLKVQDGKYIGRDVKWGEY